MRFLLVFLLLLAGCDSVSVIWVIDGDDSSTPAPPEAPTKHAIVNSVLPPPGWKSGVVWAQSVYDRKYFGSSTTEIDWVRLICVVDEQERIFESEIVGGGLFLRDPWFGDNTYEVLDVEQLRNYDGNVEYDVFEIQDRVWHMWGVRLLIPENASRCYGQVKVRIIGNTLFQVGIDWWKDQIVDYCGFNQCNREAMVSDWYGESVNWIIIDIGG